jgi:2-haloalkanoic acid dehalogenase type II
MAAGMATKATRLKAVLLDGMGTLLRLAPPAPALAEALGVDVATAERAFRAEVAYYLEHQLEAFDAERLADLRRRCANVLADAAGVPRAGALEALMASLRFEAFDDAAPALRDLRGRELTLVVVSNWDCGLSDVLERLGVRELVDAVITSAEVGAAKPDPQIFEAALAAARCAPPEALHVGDSADADIAGASAAGIRAIRIDRSERDPAGAAPGTIRALADLATLLS